MKLHRIGKPTDAKVTTGAALVMLTSSKSERERMQNMYNVDAMIQKRADERRKAKDNG